MLKLNIILNWFIFAVLNLTSFRSNNNWNQFKTIAYVCTPLLLSRSLYIVVSQRIPSHTFNMACPFGFIFVSICPLCRWRRQYARILLVHHAAQAGGVAFLSFSFGAVVVSTPGLDRTHMSDTVGLPCNTSLAVSAPDHSCSRDCLAWCSPFYYHYLPRGMPKYQRSGVPIRPVLPAVAPLFPCGVWSRAAQSVVCGCRAALLPLLLPFSDRTDRPEKTHR